MALRTAGHHHIGASAPSEDPVDVGHLWTDTVAPALKRCTSVSPYTWVSTESGGGGGGAPTDAQYLVLTANGTLTRERVLTPSNGIEGADGGAGAAYTIQPTYGSIANTVCVGNDARLSDARTPTAHATTHQSGGSDAIKLDDLAAPDDNTDLDASTVRHGLLPKLGGGTTNFLRADGSWSAPPGGSGGGNSVTATVDFGASFTDKAQVVVTGQTWVTANSEIVAQVKTASGVDPDEMRLLDFKAIISDLVAGDGFTVTLITEPEAKGTYDVMCVGV